MALSTRVLAVRQCSFQIVFCLIRRREALVYNTTNDRVTRDIREGIAKLSDLRFWMLDSAEASSGSVLGKTAGMTGNVLRRSLFVLFLTDARSTMHFLTCKEPDYQQSLWNNPTFSQYILEEGVAANVAEFSWDLKYAGAQVLLTKLFWEGHKEFESFQLHADGFICSNLPESPHHQVFFTPGGLIHLRDGANAQYVTGTAFIFSVYSDLLARHNKKVTCGNKQFTSSQLMAFAKKQVSCG